MAAVMPGLEALIRPGARVALSDGLGCPRKLVGPLCDTAESVGGVRLLVGWFPHPVADLRPEAFADVRTFMSGWGLRGLVDAGEVHALPVRLSAVPALLRGPLRPDVLLAPLVPRAGGGYGFGTEVAWMRAAVDAGAVVAGLVSPGFPSCEAGPPLPADRVVILGETGDGPDVITFTSPSPSHRAIGEHIARLVPEGARVQVGPGPLGTATLEALTGPVRVDSGLLPDGVLGLDRRGLLLSDPVATYLTGSQELFDWADGRRVLHRVEHTHDLGRLFHGGSLVTVNTALEIDEQGQINVEALGGSIIGGIGGHADYAVAGARSIGGLSIVAVPSQHKGKPTLVNRLSAPTSTPGHDVDVLVTESGTADLRGLDRVERRCAILDLWNR